MDTAQGIRHALEEVQQWRRLAHATPSLASSVARIRRLQSARFRGTYSDLLVSRQHGPAARFFLEELYGAVDASERDAQLSRIAGAVERLFPREIGATALGLARLHALTESLDHGLASALPSSEQDEASAYVLAWKSVGRREDRERQVEQAAALGTELARLTRLPGLSLMLKMMRGPAAAAGLHSLQHFLESGFATFGTLARAPGGAEHFLHTIRSREQQLLAMLHDAPEEVGVQELRRLLGQAR